MNKNHLILFLAIACMVGSLIAQHIEMPDEDVKIRIADDNPITSPDCNLRADLRRLWLSHELWMCHVMLSVTDNTPGADHAKKQLLKSGHEPGNSIKPFYGEKAGKQLKNLLSIHSTVSAELFHASKIQDRKLFDDANKKWHENEKETALFLSKANPNITL